MVNASYSPEGNVVTYVMGETGEMEQVICASNRLLSARGPSSSSGLAGVCRSARYATETLGGAPTVLVS